MLANNGTAFSKKVRGEKTPYMVVVKRLKEETNKAAAGGGCRSDSIRLPGIWPPSGSTIHRWVTHYLGEALTIHR